MTAEQFKKEVFDNNKDFFVLDNTVLQLSHYLDMHPGGKFVYTKNFGRDISKYFYGAYKLVNIPTEILHSHSPDAMLIANSMIIANLKG